MNPSSFIHAAKQGARQASQESRAERVQFGYPALLFWAVCVEAQAGGRYGITPIDDNGDKIKDPDNPTEDLVINGVPVVPADGDIEVDDTQPLWCVRFEGHDLPVIMQTGGCSGVSIFEMGIYFDPGIS
jgi:hypothetical protein